MEKDKQNSKSERYQKIQEFSERRAQFMAILEVLKAKKHFLALTLFLALSGTLMGHFFQETTYVASSTLFVQNLEDPTAASYLLNQQFGRTNKAERIETYIRFLASEAFFQSVAKKLQFSQNYDELNFSVPQSKSYFSPTTWKDRILSLFTGTTPETVTPTIKGTKDLVSLLKQFTKYETDYIHFIHIKTTSLDAKTSMRIANVIADEFVELTNKRGTQEIEQIKEFVQGKMKETEERIKLTEEQLVEFKKKNNIIATDQSSSLLAERYTRITGELESLKMQFEENEKLILFFENGQQAARAATSDQTTTNPDGTRVYGAQEASLLLYKKLEQLKRQKATILAQDENSQKWKLQDLDKEIEKTTKAFQVYAKKAGDKNLFLYMNPQKIQQRINELKEENEVTKTKLSSHKKLLDQLSEQLETIPSLTQKQLVLQNTLQVDTENHVHLKNKLTELEIQKISQKKEIRIDQSAQLPSASVKGNIYLKIIFSSCVALLLGISIIVGVESIDPSVKHRSDLRDCGLEFIGEVPLFDFSQDASAKKGFGSTTQIVTSTDPESLESMSFKYIRARIESYRYKFKKDHLVISISSGNVNDGKSLMAANLSTCLSQLNRSVLLIDCDLRRPSQNAYFDTNPAYGLVDLLNLTQPLEAVIQSNLRPNLDYISAGFCHKNSTEYISSEKFRVLVNYLKTEYDYIVIDTPPVFAAVDASIIANYSDIPILIANFRDTKKYTLSEAYNQILQISYKRVYGIINKAILSSARFHYYGYHNTATKNSDSNTENLSTYKETSQDMEQFLKNIKRKMS